MNIDELINEEINKNLLKKVNNKLFLTNGEIDVLNKFEIDFKSFSSLKEIVLLIERFISENDLSDEELDVLDEVSSSIWERYYYNDINK